MRELRKEYSKASRGSRNRGTTLPLWRKEPGINQIGRADEPTGLSYDSPTVTLNVQRRAWILGGMLATGTSAWALSPFGCARSSNNWSKKRLSNRSGPFALPPGFECVTLMSAGGTLTDGTRAADMPDGMACFLGEDGNWQLLRNHELAWDDSQGAYPTGQPDFAYRKNVNGGVSRLVIDPKTLRVLSSNMILTGTLRNCAGGETPWGWVSCEETTELHHGYSFLCPANVAGVRPPQRITAYGRFRHEAVAFDHSTYRAFLTEDDPMGCLYRFTPHHKSLPFEGTLEALRVVGRPRFNTGTHMSVETALPVDWVKVEDPQAESAPLNQQALARGAAVFSRGEGAWMDGDGVVFTATSGGKEGRGQIFRLALGPDALSLVAEARGDHSFDGPDNITVAPWGDFIVAEDGPGPQHVHGVRRDGSVYPILRNDVSSSELAGVCFSPDGKVLFVNVQVDGLTVAVRGPWETLVRS